MDPNDTGNDNNKPEPSIGNTTPFFTLRFAPSWKRALAWIIDMMLVSAVITFMASFIYSRELDAISRQTDMKLQIALAQQFITAHAMEISLALFAVACAYFVLGWTGNGQTLGARILKIAVISMDSRRLGIIQAVVRFSIIYLSAMAYFIPLIFVMNPVYHQRIMDFFTGSVVVETPEGIYKNWNNRNPDDEDNGEDRSDDDTY